MTEIRTVLGAHPVVGEGPTWAPEEKALYWTDIYGPMLNRFDPATGATQHWRMPAPLGSFALTKKNRAIVALKTGIHLFDFATGSLRLLHNPEGDRPDNRLNDGKVSPDGRFFVGTMYEQRPRKPEASLYRLDPDGKLTRVIEGGINVSNGLAWSPDGRTMYHSDSTTAQVSAWSYDAATGAISNRREFVKTTEEEGRPDGAATDMEGCYWSSGVSAGVLNRFRPDGKLDRSIKMPCAAPTMPCFAGPDLKTVYVTSLREGLSAEKLSAYPMSGSIFAFEVDVPGVAIPRFDDTRL
ncbi:MAG TPA: SMP-30/gluconolactonase/LRE family protein [Magnetospirillaceae bacterium]|jgi:sugar lactone lactonase YvrE